MRELVWVAMIGLTACGGSKPTNGQMTNANAPDCAAGAGALATSLAQEDTKAQVGAVTAAVEKRCAEDKWTEEAVNCFGAAKDKQGVADCGYNHLTQAQQDKLDKAAAPLSALNVGVLMKKMEEFRDKLCACKDEKCAVAVSDEMTEWARQFSKNDEDPQMTEEQQRQAQAIGDQMAKCMQTAMVASQPPPAPPPPLAVTGLEPAKGDAAGGTQVVIRGTSFTVDGERKVKVYFGKMQATVIRFSSDSELIVETPAGKAKQTVDVVVKFEPGGEMKLPKSFTYEKKK